MQVEMETIGAVIVGRCELHLKDICMVRTSVEPVLAFHDAQGKQTLACKKCSDHMFAIGQWYKKGEKPEPPDSPISKLNQYVTEMKLATDIDAQLAVARRYVDQRWVLSVPLDVGQFVEPYFIVEAQLRSLGWVSVAFKSTDESTPAVVRVRPVASREELEKTEGAILFVEERIR